MGVIIKSHVLLKNKGINHLVFVDNHEYEPYIPEENRADVSWGNLSLEFPDGMKTKHTSWEGQKKVYETVLNKLN